MSSQSKTITQDDVARRAGVTRSIVSYVINNGPRKVSEETRLRVLAAIKELGYRPNKHAQMLSSTDDTIAETYIGIILSNTYMFRRPYYGEILASIHEHAHEIGRHIRFIRVFEDFSNPALFNELIHPNEISGVILMGLDQVLSTPEDAALVEAIVERVERVVCVEWEWAGVPTVQFDRQNAAYQATRHLLACQKQHIAYIGPEDRRIAGYQQALWEQHTAITDSIVYTAVDIPTGYANCERLLESGSVVDGICAGSDEVAVGVLKSLHQHGLSIPGDIAVASIDNLDMSAFTIPALTSVNVPKHEIGFRAVDILVAESSWKGSSAFAITLPTELVVRESTVIN